MKNSTFNQMVYNWRRSQEEDMKLQISRSQAAKERRQKERRDFEKKQQESGE